MSDFSKDQEGSQTPVDIEDLDEVSGGLSVPLVQDAKNLVGPKTGPVSAPIQ